MCNKSCKCTECEYPIEECEIVFIDDENPFNEQRYWIKAYRCYGTGQIALQKNKV